MTVRHVLPKALVALGVVTAAVVASPGAATGATAPQPVLSYTFERLDGGVVPDVSGHGLDGRLVATVDADTLLPSLTGHGLALHLTGAQHEYVDVPQLPVLDVDRYTLSAWVRPSGVQNDATNDRWEVLEKAGAYWVNVRTDRHVRVGGFYGGCSGPGVWQYLDSTAVLPLKKWRHVAATYDGSVLKVYVGGVLSGSKRVTGRTCVSGEPLAVGAKNNPTKGLLEAFWDGRLDDVRIYAQALTATQVKALAAR
jgi:hypothetical protein